MVTVVLAVMMGGRWLVMIDWEGWSEVGEGKQSLGEVGAGL